MCCDYHTRGADLDSVPQKSPLELDTQIAVAAVLAACYRTLALQLAALEGRKHRDAAVEARVAGQLTGIQRCARLLVDDKTAFLRYENAKSL
jgi:hypothetical protein